MSSSLQSIRLVWHRRDLRVLDNKLYSGIDDNINIISLFVFDPSDFLPRASTCSLEWDTVRTGPHMARSLLDAVSKLRCKLHSIGGNLIIRIGNPVEVVPQLTKEVGATEVRWAEIPGTEERDQSATLLEALSALGNVKVVTDVTCTLYHPNDLPRESDVWMSLAHPKQKTRKTRNRKKQQCRGNQVSNEIPATLLKSVIIDVSPERLKGMCLVMGDYRRAVRTHASVREALPSPDRLFCPQIKLSFGEIPTLDDLYQPLLDRLETTSPNSKQKPILGLSPEFVKSTLFYASSRSHCEPVTSEDAALNRLNYFLSSGTAAKADRALADVTTNDDSSKLSVHLALGTISPRTIYEAALASGEGAKWLVSHLEMRDYFLYYAFLVGSGLFLTHGAPQAFKKKEALQWKDPSLHEVSKEQWTRWATGKTGFPLVDAAMREMLRTGYCSNRVRQNAASFLAKDLKFDWRAGAELYQFLLEDFCVAANWGNWAYFSGVGNDPKERHFRTVSQALRYDPTGAYVRKWVEELREIDDEHVILRPWAFIQTWPEPLVDPETQFTWHDWSKISDKLLQMTSDKRCL